MSPATPSGTCTSPPSEEAGSSWYMRNIPCPRQGCGRMYSSNSSLRNHLRRKHKGILDIVAGPAAVSAVVPIPPARQHGHLDGGRTSPQSGMLLPPNDMSRSLPHDYGRYIDVARQHYRHLGGPRQRMGSSRSAGDVRGVTHLHGSRPSSRTDQYGRTPSTEHDYLYPGEYHSQQRLGASLELTRSLSEPGRRWPRQPSHGSGLDIGDDCGSEDLEAFQRGAAAIEKILAPQHHKHQWSPTTRPLPEDRCLDAPSFTYPPVQQRPRLQEQYEQEQPSFSFRPVTTPSNATLAPERSLMGSATSMDSVNTARSYWCDSNNMSATSDSSDQHPHRRVPSRSGSAESVMAIGETLKRTRLNSSEPLKFSIQNLLGISA